MRLSQSEIEIITSKAFDRGVRYALAGDGEADALREAAAVVRDELEKAGVLVQRKRRAVVDGDGASDRVLRQVQNYLPGNFEAHIVDDCNILIEGYDRAGWTLDGYVIPRLASGLIAAKEVSHVEG